MICRTSVLVVLSFLPCVLSGADEAPRHQLRILAVGDPPPFRQEQRDGGRYEVAPPEGSVPPRFVSVGSASSVPGTPPPVRVRLGQPSEPIEFPQPETRKATVRAKDGQRWLDVPLSTGGRSLALVCRGASDWKQARAVVVPDDAAARAEGRVHFANLSDRPLGLVHGNEKIRLEPGKHFTRTLESSGDAMLLRVFCESSPGALVLCHSGVLERQPGLCHKVIVFKADGVKNRTPVKVLQVDEAASPAQVVASSNP